MTFIFQFAYRHFEKSLVFKYAYSKMYRFKVANRFYIILCRHQITTSINNESKTTRKVNAFNALNVFQNPFAFISNKHDIYINSSELFPTSKTWQASHNKYTWYSTNPIFWLDNPLTKRQKRSTHPNPSATI